MLLGSFEGLHFAGFSATQMIPAEHVAFESALETSGAVGMFIFSFT